MRKRFLLCGAGLLCLFAVSAVPSHAQTCSTIALVNTPYLVFGPQAVGTTSLAQTATLTFSTGCPTATVTLSGSISPAGDFVAPDNAGTCPGATLTLTNGTPMSCTVRETFVPTALGTRTATANINWTLNNVAATTNLNLIGGDEIAYVTTGSGGQVLTVDTANQNVFQVLSNAPVLEQCDGPCAFNPTGVVVGPDAKIYVTDPVKSNIWRMNQDGSQIEEVFNQATCTISHEAPCPGKSAEGPSFNGNDLYFNTADSGDGLVAITGAAAVPFGGTFNVPIAVEPCSASHTNCPYGGAGTAFDASGNLLAADQENGQIWSLASPYVPSIAPAAILPNQVDIPTGIALNKADGQVYLANSDGSEQILRVVPPLGATPNYTVVPYYTFTGTTSAVCNGSSNFPDYMQFDMTGHLVAVTSASPQPGGANNCGKVWRIDPPTPTATTLLDMNGIFAGGITNVCIEPCGLNSAQAVGVALPPTQGQTQTVPLLPGGGTATVGWPIGCTPTNTPGNNCSATIGIQYPAGMFGPGDTLNVMFGETTQAQFTTNTFGTPYATTTLAPVEGYNGNGIVPTLECTNGGGACTDINTSSAYDIFTTWQSSQTNYCTLIPHLLKGDPANGPYDQLLIDTLISCSDGGVGTKGQSSCTSTTSTTQCLSAWPNAFGPITGPVFTASASITSPSNGAAFNANQFETTTFTCALSPASSIPPPCPGVVTQPDGSIVSVASGGTLPTSQAGTYTLLVNPNVSGVTDTLSCTPTVSGTLCVLPGAASVQYTVSGYQFIGFAAPITNTPALNVATAGQAIPVAFQVLDPNGNPVTNLTLAQISFSFMPTSCQNFSTADGMTIPDLPATGNSGLQNLGGGNYQYNWKTAKSQKGTCGQLQVRVGNGSIQTADFQFK